jgi:hypothetical protein
VLNGRVDNRGRERLGRGRDNWSDSGCRAWASSWAGVDGSDLSRENSGREV